jgi:Ca-activated chloride channel family protein
MKASKIISLLPALTLACFVAVLSHAQTAEKNGAQVKADDLRLAVDLVVIDAQVFQQKTSRIVGSLKREDFILSEDGARQQITHFSQDTLPLSVILLVDRGSCLDPFSHRVHEATLEAISRLKPNDEVALMTFSDDVEIIQGFTYDRGKIARALDRLPAHNEEAGHCYNLAFHQAAHYMRRAGNPDGRRVIIVISTVTTAFDCAGPSGDEMRQTLLESGTVVCGVIPKTKAQRMESGAMRAATGIGGMFGVKKTSINKLAEETGGVIFNDKPEEMDRTFNNLINHLRTRYSIGFVSSNTKRDGAFRKLKLEVSPALQKSDEKLVVKTRRGYIASKGHEERVETLQPK